MKSKNHNAPIDQSGTTGFNPQLAGRAKASHGHTSGFGSGPPDYTLPGYPSGKQTAWQEEGDRKRQPTSSAGRAGRKKERNQP